VHGAAVAVPQVRAAAARRTPWLPLDSVEHLAEACAE
jgi:hypothetical protein